MNIINLICNIDKQMLLFCGFSVFIGIKKLLALIDMARQTDPKVRVIKFLTKMEEEGCLDLGTMIH